MTVKSNGKSGYRVEFKATATLPKYYKSFLVRDYGSLAVAHAAALDHNEHKMLERKGENLPEGELKIPGYNSPNITGTTFEIIAREYIEYIEGQVLREERAKESTDNLITKITGILIPYFGPWDPIQIDHGAINEFKNTRIKDPGFWGKKVCRVTETKTYYQKRRPANKRTLQDDARYIKAICKFGAGWFDKSHIRRDTLYTLEDLQCLDYSIGSLKKKTEREQISYAEYKGLMECAAPHIQRVLFLGFRMGVRPGKGEQYHMKWLHWTITDEVVSVRIRSAKRKDEDEKWRTVSVENETEKEMIRRWFKADGEDLNKYFISWRNKPVKRYSTGFNNAWARASEKYGWSREVHPYLLRHGFGAALKSAGVDASIGAKIMGNSPEMFISNYGKVTDDQISDAMSSLPDVPDFDEVKRKDRPSPGKVVKLRKKKAG